MNKPVSFTRGLVLVNALIWFAFSIIVASGMHPALPDSEIYKWLLAAFTLFSAAFLLLLYFLLKTRTKITFFLTISFLILIAMFIIMDELGWVDFLLLVITITPIVILIKERKWFLIESGNTQE